MASRLSRPADPQVQCIARVKVFDFPEAARKKLLEFLPSDDHFVTPPTRKAAHEPETRKLLADEFRRIVWVLTNHGFDIV
jgi:hypothetical protein